MNKTTLWITRTALLLALLIAVQYITNFIPKPANVFVTGSLVNMILVIAAMSFNLSTGLTVAGLSPLFALLIGVQSPVTWPVFYMISIANMVLVFFVWLFTNNTLFQPAGKVLWKSAIGLLIGSLLKFLILWVLLAMILLPMPVFNIPSTMLPLLQFSFSWPQLVTALIGGILALSIAPTIKKALERSI